MARVVNAPVDQHQSNTDDHSNEHPGIPGLGWRRWQGIAYEGVMALVSHDTLPTWPFDAMVFVRCQQQSSGLVPLQVTGEPVCGEERSQP